eukprot:scaffold12837_cov66-Phaeocystis_antarctica.AAC.4
MGSSKRSTALSLASRSAFVNCRYRKGCGGLKLYGDPTEGKTTHGTCEACDQVIPSPRREKRTRPTSPTTVSLHLTLLAWQDRYKILDDPPYYALTSEALSWGHANAACLAAGLQLATVRSAAQNAQLRAVAGGNTVWIGGTDAASEGAWVWSPSNTPLSYTNWNAGEPNDHGSGEDCVVAYGSGKWNDARCTNKYKYVCQPPFPPWFHDVLPPYYSTDTPWPLQVAQPLSRTSPLKSRPPRQGASFSPALPPLGATVRVVRPPNLLGWLLPWWHGLHRNRIWHAGRTGRRYLELGG